MPTTALLTFATALFTICNPIGNAAIFADMVAGRPARDRTRTAIKCAAAVAVILVGSVWIGDYALRLFGLKIPALQVAGAVMIAHIAMQMLCSKRSTMHSTGESTPDASPDDEVAIVPLAMPIVAGPGAIVTVLISTHQHTGLEANLLLSAVCLAMATLIGAAFLAASRLTRLIGPAGMDIVTKLMGMVLLAIAVAMAAEGVKALLPGLAS